MIVAMLKVGQWDMKLSRRTCSLKLKFPRSYIFFSTGILLGSWAGSGWSLSQLVWIKNHSSSLNSQQAWTESVSLSITIPQFTPTPETTKQTGPPMTSVLSLLVAAAQVVYSAKTFLKSQRVGIALLTKTLMRSSLKCLAFLVSQLMAKAPCLIPVKAKTLPATVSTLQIFWSPLQYSTLAMSFAKISHISKSKFRPCRTLPQAVLMRIPVQALKVEYSYIKLRKKIFSKGKLLNLETASTSATKS